MTDTSVLHGYGVLLGKLEDNYNELPEWKKKALEGLLTQAWEVIEANDRRNKSERRGK